MRKPYSLVLLFLLVPLVASAGPRGRDYLGGAKFCSVIKGTHERGAPVGFFATEFGDALPCADELLRLKFTNDIRIQLVWRATHDYDSRARGEAVAEAVRWERLARKYPDAHIYLSGACEHNLGQSTAQELANGVKRAAPHTTYVNSPWKGALLKNEINEVHGGNPKKPAGRYIVSTDGTSFFDIDSDLWQKAYCEDSNNIFCFGWAPRDNCRQQGTTEPPKQRKACTFEEYNRTLFRALKPKQTVPVFSPKPVKLAFPFLWKVDSEDKAGNNDPRANKPVALMPLNWTGDATVKDSKGNQVCKLKRVTPDYEISGKAVATRHYSGTGCRLSGGQIADVAEGKSKNDHVTICYGKECFGPVEAAKRCCYFR